MADKNAETIRSAGDDFEIAHQESRRALAGLIPDIQVSGQYYNVKNDDYISPDSRSLGVKLGQTYTLNGREFVAWDISKKAVKKAGFSVATVRAEYFLNIAKIYFQIFKSLRHMEIAQADVTRLTAHRDFVKEQLGAGDVTKTALFRAKAELAKSLTTKLVARNDVRRNKADMIRLTGAERGFSVTDKGISDLEKFSATFETVLDRALENRYEVKQLQINLEMAAQKIEYEKGAYWPALILEGGYRETDVSYDFYGQKDGYDTEDAYIQANLVFTLFDGADRGARMKKAVLEVKKIRQDLSAQKKQIVYESETAFLDLETARETLYNLEEELISARENYSAVQMQFKYGMTDSIEIMDANTLMVQAQTRMADARYTLYLAVLKIIYTQGNLIHYLLSFA